MGCKRYSCKYHAPPGAWNNCDYALKTGTCKIIRVPRELMESGKCPLYEPAQGEKHVVQTSIKRKPSSAAKRIESKYDWHQARKMWETGSMDREIAEKLGCAVNTVSAWRKKNDLSSRHGKRASVIDWEKGMKLYSEGKSDGKIAEALGCAKVSVRHWRTNKGLPPNYEERKERNWDTVWDLYYAGMNDAQISKVTGIPSSTIWGRRTRLGLPANTQASTANTQKKDE